MDTTALMHLALEEAQKGAEIDEVPVGALVLSPEGEILSRQHNLKENLFDPSAHAEVLAIREASQKLNSWRLTGCTLVVTLEPCMMCAGAIWQSRLQKLVYGAHDPKAGFISSLYEPFQEKSLLNHKPEIISGVLATECGALLKNFFRKKRSK